MSSPDGKLVVNPVAVLTRLCPTEPSRPAWRAWVTAVHGTAGDPGQSASTLSTLNALCIAIDRVAADAGVLDVLLVDALRADLLGLETSTGHLAQQLDKATVGTLRNLLQASCPEITMDDLAGLIERCEDLTGLLGAVSTADAPVAQAAALALVELTSDLRCASQLGVLFVNPVVFAQQSHSLIAYGLTLQREGVPREAQLLLTIAITLAGLVPILALPAAAAAVGLALLDRADEQERLGRRAMRRIEGSKDTRTDPQVD